MFSSLNPFNWFSNLFVHNEPDQNNTNPLISFIENKLSEINIIKQEILSERFDLAQLYSLWLRKKDLNQSTKELYEYFVNHEKEYDVPEPLHSEIIRIFSKNTHDNNGANVALSADSKNHIEELFRNKIEKSNNELEINNFQSLIYSLILKVINQKVEPQNLLPILQNYFKKHQIIASKSEVILNHVSIFATEIQNNKSSISSYENLLTILEESFIDNNSSQSRQQESKEMLEENNDFSVRDYCYNLGKVAFKALSKGISYAASHPSQAFTITSLGLFNLVKANPSASFFGVLQENDQYDFARSISKTSDNSFVVGGYMNGAITSNTDEALLLKFANNSSFLWGYLLGGTGSAAVYFMKETMDNNLIFVGETNNNILVTKISLNNGTILWSKALDGNNFESGTSFEELGDGSLIIIGSIWNNTGDTSYDCSIVKLSGDGSNLLWANTFGGSDYDEALAIAEMQDGNLLVQSNSKSFTNGILNPFITKFSPNGTLLWSKILTTVNASAGYSLQNLADGNFIITGVLNNEPMIANFSPNGTLNWANTISITNYSSYGLSTLEMLNGNLFFVGGATPATNNQGLLFASFSNNGSFLWSNILEGQNNYLVYAIDQTTEGEILISGHTNNFPPTPSYHIFFIKTEKNGNIPLNCTISINATSSSIMNLFNISYINPQVSPLTISLSNSNLVAQAFNPTVEYPCVFLTPAPTPSPTPAPTPFPTPPVSQTPPNTQTPVTSMSNTGKSSSSQQGVNIGAIVGGVISVIVAVAAAIIGVFLYRRRKASKKSDNLELSGNNNNSKDLSPNPIANTNLNTNSNITSIAINSTTYDALPKVTQDAASNPMFEESTYDSIPKVTQRLSVELKGTAANHPETPTNMQTYAAVSAVTQQTQAIPHIYDNSPNSTTTPESTTSSGNNNVYVDWQSSQRLSQPVTSPSNVYNNVPPDFNSANSIPDADDSKKRKSQYNALNPDNRGSTSNSSFWSAPQTQVSDAAKNATDFNPGNRM